jgi:hypothetical protein
MVCELSADIGPNMQNPTAEKTQPHLALKPPNAQLSHSLLRRSVEQTVGYRRLNDPIR